MTSAQRALAADFQQGMADEPGVPNRRDAGLAIGLVLADGQQLLDRFAGDGALRIGLRIAEHREHHHAVRHCREDRAEPVFTVETLAHPGDGAIDGALTRALGKVRLGRAQDVVDAAEEPEPGGLLLRRLGRRADALRRFEKKLVDAHALGVARLRLLRHQHQQRDDDGAAPIRDLVEMEREPFRQQHDLDRHHRHGAPGDESEQRQHDPREHVGTRGAAAGEHRLARATHVLRLDRIADHLEREISLDGRADIQIAVLK